MSYGEAGHLQSFTDCHFDDNLAFSVHAGGTIHFGFTVFNGAFAGTAYFTSFSYRPFWLPLAGALGGSAGLPALTGHGVLKAGEPFGIELAGAAPAAATALVVGFGQSNLPFKGGLLVPTPTLILPGFATDGLGGLSVGSIWPATPPGTTLVVQAWIADAGAPQGFAASNAVQGFAF